MTIRRPVPGTGIDATRLGRRDLLRLFGASALVALSVPATVRQALAAPIFVTYPFQLGVAAGDPAPDGFVIWTRLAPLPLEPGYGMPMQPVEIEWQVAEDTGFRTVAQQGTVVARPELGHACHVEVGGLQPGRTYFYRFTAGDERSIVGRARTLPAAGAMPEQIRFAVAGCQSYEQGYYTAFRDLALQDELDFVFHYGDYIYEYDPRPFTFDRHLNRQVPIVRDVPGTEIMTLDDYRRRYAVYKMDPDLQLAHASAAFIPTWDDHEIDNNWAANIAQDGVPPEVFDLRRVAAAQAYYENMPLRRTSWPLGPAIRLYRRFEAGGLMSFSALDTRQYRSDQPCGDGVKAVCPEIDDPKATMLGAEQEKWLFEGLARSKARWNAIGQQVVVMAKDFGRADGETRNLDAWDGYRVPRQRLMDHLHDRKIRNTVILTGDMHQNVAGDLHRRPDDPASPIVASEFVATSISSGFDGGEARSTYPTVLSRNPHIKFMNDQRGYMLHTVRQDRWEAAFRVVDKVRTPDGTVSTRATLVVEADAPGLKTA